jgi:hypothetical protein
MEWGEGGPSPDIVETLKCPDCGFERGIATAIGSEI